MKKFTIQAAFLVIIMMAALAFATAKIPQIPLPNTTQKSNFSEVKINDLVVKVEIADTQSKRQKGLGDRESLATDSGMLFIFPETKKYNFWMKGLKFPLDIIWIRAGVVVDVIKNAEPPLSGQADETLPIYTSNELIDSVIEVNAGFVDQQNIKVGDKVTK